MKDPPRMKKNPFSKGNKVIVEQINSNCPVPNIECQSKLFLLCRAWILGSHCRLTQGTPTSLAPPPPLHPPILC